MTKRLKLPALAPPPVTAVILVDVTMTTLVALMAVGPAPLPWAISTVAPETKPVPVMVIAVPPLVGPVFGETELTVGCETTVKAKVCDAFGAMPLLAVIVSGYVPEDPAAGVPPNVAVPLPLSVN